MIENQFSMKCVTTTEQNWNEKQFFFRKHDQIVSIGHFNRIHQLFGQLIDYKPSQIIWYILTLWTGFLSISCYLIFKTCNCNASIWHWLSKSNFFHLRICADREKENKFSTESFRFRSDIKIPRKWSNNWMLEIKTSRCGMQTVELLEKYRWNTSQLVVWKPDSGKLWQQTEYVLLWRHLF